MADQIVDRKPSGRGREGCRRFFFLPKRTISLTRSLSHGRRHTNTHTHTQAGTQADARRAKREKETQMMSWREREEAGRGTPSEGDVMSPSDRRERRSRLPLSPFACFLRRHLMRASACVRHFLHPSRASVCRRERVCGWMPSLSPCIRVCVFVRKSASRVPNVTLPRIALHVHRMRVRVSPAATAATARTLVAVAATTAAAAYTRSRKKKQTQSHTHGDRGRGDARGEREPQAKRKRQATGDNLLS